MIDGSTNMGYKRLWCRFTCHGRFPPLPSDERLLNRKSKKIPCSSAADAAENGHPASSLSIVRLDSFESLDWIVVDNIGYNTI
jgi:hypothetical protein